MAWIKTGKEKTSPKRYSLVVCDSPPLIWYRIPRAASHTIHSVLQTLGIRRPLLYSETETTVRADERHEDPRYFKFTFVRNPWDRFTSTWRYFCQKEPKNLSMTVDQFITYLETNPELKLDLHVRAQSDLIPIRWDALDFVGRMENLNEHLEYVIHKCLPHVDSRNLSIPHLHSSEQTRRIDSDDSAKIHAYVMKKYEEDIRLLGYGSP